MVIQRNSSGYMTEASFRYWLRKFGNARSRPSLLLMDYCPAHYDVDDGDPDMQQPWNYLRIVRLPPNSTSVTQPLDAGINIVFTRKFLAMVNQEAGAKSYGSKRHIESGKAWSLIPFS